MADWPKFLLLGIMVERVEGRHARADAANIDLIHRVCELIPRVEDGQATPDEVRSLVRDSGLKLDRANFAARARVAEDAGRLANYITGHMRMRFRRGGRARLVAVVADHLEALDDATPERTLDAERRLGDIGRVADELEQAIAARRAAPAKPCGLP